MFRINACILIVFTLQGELKSAWGQEEDQAIKPIQSWLFDFYDESYYLSRERIWASFTRLDLVNGYYFDSYDLLLGPYIGAGYEFSRSAEKGMHVFQHSYYYMGGGLKAQRRDLQLWIGAKQRHYAWDDQKALQTYRPDYDYYTLLVYSPYTQLHAGAPGTYSLYVDLYCEYLYSTADHNNHIASILPRLGVKSATLPFFVNIQIESALFRDKVRHFYYNRFEPKVNFSLNYYTKPVSVGLLLSYMRVHYFEYLSDEQNPYLDKKYGGRILLYLDGTI